MRACLQSSATLKVLLKLPIFLPVCPSNQKEKDAIEIGAHQTWISGAYLFTLYVSTTVNVGLLVGGLDMR